MKDYLSQFKSFDIDLESLISKCELLYSFLEKNNRQINLTRIVSRQDFWIKHIADSLFILQLIPELTRKKYEIADLGCGAGFPSLVLASALPKSRITAIDSVGKKIDFVSRAGELMDLQNLSPVKGRGRELAAKIEWQGKFDIITARAVSEAKKIFREVRRMLKPNGKIILYKTPETAEMEIREIPKTPEFSWEISPVFLLPDSGEPRCFIVGTFKH